MKRRRLIKKLSSQIRECQREAAITVYTSLDRRVR